MDILSCGHSFYRMCAPLFFRDKCFAWGLLHKRGIFEIFGWVIPVEYFASFGC